MIIGIILPMDVLRVLPAGDSAVLVELGDKISPQISRQVHSLAAAVEKYQFHGLGEAVPGYTTLLIHFDPLILTMEAVTAHIGNLSAQISTDLPLATGRCVDIPVVYDGPDLLSLAEAKNLSPSELIQIHSSREYLVYMIGFTPGFAYLGEVDERIAAPRLASPRKLVPAGSVGIAGRQTGVYPIDSPGGWQLIGQTNLRFFNPYNNQPSLLAPGDTVIFRPVEALT